MLSIVFFSIATFNLGATQIPQSTVKFSSGSSFYLDLGAERTVQSVYLLLKDGTYSIAVSTGSPGDWRTMSSNLSFTDYYKWQEIAIRQGTQYLKFDFNPSSSAEIAEIVLLDETGQKIPVASLNSSDSGNQNLSNLVDEQDKVQLPPTYMSQTYFDEIYFVKTAEQYLRLQWPYEWTHPPLGKLIQAAGIVIFGLDPFGWRIMGVIFATLMIPVMYMLGKKLFGTWIGAFASAFLLTFDFMHFTMGRMGTADTYVVFFSLLSQLFFLIYFLNVAKDGWKTSVLPLFLAVVFFALGFSTKWLVLYGFVGMMALLLALRIKDVVKLKEGLGAKYAAVFDHPFLLLLGFFAVAVGIYFLTYIPDMLIGRTLPDVVKLQFDMYHYHSTLTATHSFASPWWSWPFLVSPKGYVPLWLSVSYLPNSVKSTIAVLGNPAVWWVGLASIIAITAEALKGEELASRLRARITKKPQSHESVENVEDALTVEDANRTIEAKTHFKNSITAVAGFLLFTVTAVCAEVFNYHSFFLALPIYAGLFMAAYGMVETLRNQSDGKHAAAIFITMVFFFSWIPYVFISRVTFIYHFYVSVPFLCLASAYFISKHWHTKWGKVAAIAFFVSVVVMFGLFYDVISGAPAPTSWIDNLKWFPSWYF